MRGSNISAGAFPFQRAHIHCQSESHLAGFKKEEFDRQFEAHAQARKAGQLGLRLIKTLLKHGTTIKKKKEPARGLMYRSWLDLSIAAIQIEHGRQRNSLKLLLLLLQLICARHLV